MISNKHKYTLKRAMAFMLAPLYSLFSCFLKKNKNIVLTSSLNSEFSDNSRALFEILYEDENYRDRVFFVLNDNNLRARLNKIYPNKFIHNKSFKNCIFILRAGFWFCSSLEMPAPSFFQRFIRKVYHLGHGMPMKKFGLLENKVSWYKRLYYFFITTNISKSVVTADFFEKYISEGYGLRKSQLIKMPQPKTSQIGNPIDVPDSILMNSDLTHILYAPTWRPYANVELFPFDDLNLSELSSFLIDNGVHIWLRAHPRFEQYIDKKLLDISNIHLFSAKDFSEINLYLAHFDALITDYSSIYFDYITLNRPVLFFDYDFEKYNKIVGVIDDYCLIKCTETTYSQKHFIRQLLEIKQEMFGVKQVLEINRVTNYYIEYYKIKEFILKKLLF